MARSAFEDAKNAILRESRLNGGLDPQAIFDLIVASNADSAERDQKTMTKLDAHAVILANHERANQAREERFVRAEHETLAIAAEEMRQLHELHVKECHTPRAPRRAGDPPDEVWPKPEDEQLGDMRRFWRMGKWAALVFGAAVLVALADIVVRLIFGT